MRHPFLLPIVLIAFAAGMEGRAQLMRAGPLTTSLSLNLDTTFTTNVDGVPDEVYDANGLDARDIYITYGFALGVAGEILRGLDLNLSADLAREKHFIRDDLDDRGDIPLTGDLNFDVIKNAGYFTYGFILQHNAESEWDETEIFVPGGTNLVRDIVQTTSAELTGSFARGRWSADTSYLWEWERHIDEYSEGDRNEETFDFSLDFALTKSLLLFFEYERTETEILESAAGPTTDSRERYGVEFDFSEAFPMRRPTITYELAYLREVEDDEDKGDDIQHTISVTLSEPYIVGPMEVSLGVEYTFEHDPEEEDISLIYTAEFRHRINAFLSQQLTLTKEPTRQFGVTQDADETEANYTFTWDDFLIRSMRFAYSYEWTRTKPDPRVGGPTETTKSWDITVDYTRSLAIWRGVSSTLAYSYEYVDEDTQEAYDTHELILSMTYAF